MYMHMHGMHNACICFRCGREHDGSALPVTPTHPALLWRSMALPPLRSWHAHAPRHMGQVKAAAALACAKKAVGRKQ